MIHNVYFADKVVTFARERCGGYDMVIELSAGERVERNDILHRLTECGSILILSEDEDAAFEKFAAEFKRVEAAGGAVIDNNGCVLMIYRNHRWDLPKGHVELYEPTEDCARREVREETGIVVEQQIEHLCDTLHCYDLYGRWEMKCTHWYLMRYSSGETLPQQEEGIVRAEWLGGERLKSAVESSFPTIRQVFCRLIEKLND